MHFDVNKQEILVGGGGEVEWAPYQAHMFWEKSNLVSRVRPNSEQTLY